MNLSKLANKIIYITLLSFALSGCFLTGIVPSGKTNKTGPTSPSKPAIEVVPGSNPAARISNNLLLRRISLDLKGDLPPTSDLEAVAEDENLMQKFLVNYLYSGSTIRYLSNLHGIMWRLNPGILPDLEEFIKDSAGITQADLTAAVRAQIVREPTEMIRNGLEQGMKYSEIFALDYGITYKDNLSLWQQEGTGIPWPGELWQFVEYSDARPKGGPLVTNGFLAAISVGKNTNKRSMSANLMKTVMCTDFGSVDVHNFATLSAEELTTDLSELAITKTQCVGCHAQYNEFASVLDGLADGNSFGQWTNSSAPSEPLGKYAGHIAENEDAVFTNIGKDPRTHRCSIRRFIETTLQKPLSEIDQNIFAHAIRTFYETDENFIEALKPIIESGLYSFNIADSKVTNKYLRQSTGIKFLNKIQWSNIVKGFGQSASQLEVPTGLTPGADETVALYNGIPGGTYWHNAMRFSRQVAAAIVNDELADGINPESRILLTSLPIGAGSGISAADAMLQLDAIWYKLTSTKIDNSTKKYADLLALWNATLEGGKTDDNYRNAWRAMLIAVFTDFDFLSY